MTATDETLRGMRLSIPLVVLYLTLAQLAVGMGVIQIVYAQRQPTMLDSSDREITQLSTRQGDMGRRITSLEQQKLDTRLAVVEQAQVDQRESSKEQRQLMYAILIALCGSIFAHILQLRANRPIERIVPQIIKG